MAQFKYFVGIDIASSTFTASMGAMPWKVVLKPQEFENWLTWLAWQQVLPPQTVICMGSDRYVWRSLSLFRLCQRLPSCRSTAFGSQTGLAIDLEIQRLIESDSTFKPMLRLLLSVLGVGFLLVLC
jgi:hypothetical protein